MISCSHWGMFDACYHYDDRMTFVQTAEQVFKGLGKLRVNPNVAGTGTLMPTTYQHINFGPDLL